MTYGHSDPVRNSDLPDKEIKTSSKGADLLKESSPSRMNDYVSIRT